MFNHPPDKPGIKPHWTSSAKSGVGTAIDPESRVWFSVAYGILDEIYHPFIDSATTRDFGFLVADGHDFFSEEKRDTDHEIHPLEQGAPGYRLINTCKQGRYRITKTIVTDPRRDVLLQHIRFEALQGRVGRLHALRAAESAHRQPRHGRTTAGLGTSAAFPCSSASATRRPLRWRVRPAGPNGHAVTWGKATAGRIFTRTRK